MRRQLLHVGLVITAFALSSARAPLFAQAAATLEAVATRISYAETPGSTGWSLTSGAHLLRPTQSLAASGSWARFPEGVWSVQGQLAGSAYLPQVAGLRPEVEARGGGSRHQDGGTSGELAGALRMHWLGEPLGLWLGGDGGRTWNGASWITDLSAEAGGWVRTGPGIVALAISASRVGSDLRFAEMQSTFRLDRGALELVAWGGLRQWFSPDDASASAWAGATAAWWIGDRMAVTAGGGSYPVDYAQGLPAGRFGTLGIRVATGRIARARRVNERLDLLLAPPVRDGGAALQWQNADSGKVVLLLQGVTAKQVEIMGDFTAWEPVPMAPIGADRWSVTLPIAPGIYRMNFRSDAGEWRVPPGMHSSSDEFGGDAGILIVE